MMTRISSFCSSFWLIKGGLRDAIKVAWPLTISMASMAIMQFADRIFLSRYSDEAIQAALPAGVFAFLVLSFFQAAIGYSGTFVAQYHGAKKPMSCARTLGQGLWLSIAVAPIMLLLIPAGYFFMGLADHAPEVYALEKTYFRILVYGGLIVPVVAALSGFFSGRGHTRLIMVANIIGNLFNVILNYLLIFGVGIFPEMGIAGAAWATVMGQSITMIIIGTYALADPLLRGAYRKRVAFVFCPDLTWQIARFGTPAGLHILLDVMAFTIFVMITGWMDPLSFAVSNICFSINFLIFAPLMGIGLAASVLTGQFKGEGDLVAAKRVGWSAEFLGLIYLAIATIIILTFNTKLLMMFRSPHSSFDLTAYLALGETLIMIFLCWAISNTFNIVLGGALKGAGDTKFVMYFVTACNMFFWLPLVFITYNLGGSIIQLWLTLPLYVALLGIGILIRWQRNYWHKIKMI